MFTFWLFSFSFLFNVRCVRYLMFNVRCVQCIALLVTFSIITLSLLALVDCDFLSCACIPCLFFVWFLCVCSRQFLWPFFVVVGLPESLQMFFFPTLYAHSISNVKLPSALDMCVHFGLCISPSISVAKGSRGGHCFRFWLQSDYSSNLLTLLSYDAGSLKQ